MNKIFTPNLRFKLETMKDADALMLLFDKIQEFEDLLYNKNLYINAVQTVLTEGSLSIGKRYRIVKYNKGDDFTFVGASENKTNTEFVAKRAVPFWGNRSELVQIELVSNWEVQADEIHGE